MTLMFLVACATAKTKLPTQTLDIAGHAVQVELADDPAERQQGLMFREKLPEDNGLLFVYPSPQPLSFWMANTSIPLSIAYLDETGRIINIEDMAPFDRSSVRSAAPAMYALEMNQGWFADQGIEHGAVISGLPGPSEL